jgi:hypothetical protein
MAWARQLALSLPHRFKPPETETLLDSGSLILQPLGPIFDDRSNGSRFRLAY